MIKMIIEPIDRAKLITELKFCKFIKYTFRSKNEIYSFVNTDAPTIMLEVGRLREEAFRSVGYGTGDIVDLDDHDMGVEAYQHIFVWNPNSLEIIGGCRYAIGANYLQQVDRLSMSNSFLYSHKFKSEYLPYSIELGRAWVNPAYRSMNSISNPTSVLNNLWEGIGAIISENKNVRYLYGNVVIPENYNPTARILLTWFLNHYFKGKTNLLSPRQPVVLPRVLAIADTKVTGKNLKTDYKIITDYIKSHDTGIPPLLSAYLRLAKRITTFGTTTNPNLENTFETGILIAIKDIHPEKHSKYISTVQQKQLMLVG